MRKVSSASPGIVSQLLKSKIFDERKPTKRLKIKAEAPIRVIVRVARQRAKCLG